MRVELDFDALRSNISYIKSVCATTIPVLKGQCYGLGLDAIHEVAKNFEVVAVHDIREAEALRLSGYRHEILVLGGVVSTPMDSKIIPVLNFCQVTSANIPYAIFSDYGCRRLNVAPSFLRLRDPEYLLYHSFHYKTVISVDACLENAETYRCPTAKLSIGSTANLLHVTRHIRPRVGLAFSGYDSAEGLNDNLIPVKSVYARIIDCVSTPGSCNVFGYGLYSPHSNSYVYSIDVGTYDHMYHTVEPTLFDTVSKSLDKVQLISGSSAVGMNISFLLSEYPQRLNTEIELLGVNTKATTIASTFGLSIANVLRIGSNVN